MHLRLGARKLTERILSSVANLFTINRPPANAAYSRNNSASARQLTHIYEVITLSSEILYYDQMYAVELSQAFDNQEFAIATWGGPDNAIYELGEFIWKC